MADTQEDSNYRPNYGLNQGFTQSQIVGKYADEDDDEAEEDDEEQEQEQEETDVGDNEMNGTSTQQNGNDNDHHHQYDDDEDDDNDDDDDDGDDNTRRMTSVNLQRHPKKRKLKSLLSSFEFSPRVAPPSSVAPPKPSFGGRNTLTDWSEHETFVLLDAWGERFLQCGRKSLRSEEWQEVADRVSQESKIERTDSQCRNRLDTLKKKYKKEKASLTGSRGVNTKWVYFKKMDMLLSGENAYMNPNDNLNPANGVDDMRDSGGNSDSQEGDDDSDLLPPKKLKFKGGGGGGGGGGGSFRLLAESINKFSEIYEKIENGKIQQMIELEKMRMDFHKDLEMQKRKILDRAQAEITKVRQGDYEENDGSAENVSG
ncbi:unnamed protein product [Lactuca saligna]|uniref:Myb-like domain-containing protein n=1 Tax=Lactuca saligna TaxID=75948 RepID=A0AA35YWA8_LACSI|nr:unnamed protein product [Lactuca saligna]